MDVTIEQLPVAEINARLNQLADLLRDAVENGASVNFVLPFSQADAVSFWRKIAGDVERGAAILLVAVADDRIVGSALLALAWQPNAPHRAEVQKMLVDSAYRRRGIAAQMLNAIEDTARSIGRWLLFLDTENGNVAAKALYEQAGFAQVGVIPQHALNAAGEYADTILYYKLLRS